MGQGGRRLWREGQWHGHEAKRGEYVGQRIGLVVSRWRVFRVSRSGGRVRSGRLRSGRNLRSCLGNYGGLLDRLGQILQRGLQLTEEIGRGRIVLVARGANRRARSRRRRSSRRRSRHNGD